MNHHGLFIKLMEKRIPVMLLRVIEHWFSIGNRTTCVKWGIYFSHSFELLCGVRQAAKVACYLRICLLYTLIVCIRRLQPRELIDAISKGCVLADDIILLAPSVSAFQHLLDVCESELQYLDMSINVNKSVCPGLARVMHSPVVTYLLRMLARLFGVSPLGTVTTAPG